MDILFTFFFNLTITLTGFVLPIFSISLSYFTKGIEKHQERENQQIDNIQTELGKLTSEADSIAKDGNHTTKKNETDNLLEKKVEQIQKQLKRKRAEKARSQRRMRGFSPKYQIKQLSLPLFSSLFILFYVRIIDDLYFTAAAYCVLVLLISSFFHRAWSAVMVLVEARKITGDDENERQKELSDLMSKLAKMDTVQNMEVLIDEQPVVDEMRLRLEIGKEHALTVSAVNKESSTTAKNVEVGFRIPKGLNVVKKEDSGYTIYLDKGGSEKIVRFMQQSIHGKTNNIFHNPLIIKPTDLGSHNVRCFIKGDNVETIYKTFTVDVSQKVSQEIL